MKQMICEMCGSTDLLKLDGLYVCQKCGAKYTVEEAKKLIVDIADKGESTAETENTDDLDKLYLAARNAKEVSDYETAMKHYEAISAKDPDSWEALFYLTALKVYSTKNGELGYIATLIAGSLPKIFELVKQNVKAEEIESAILEIALTCKTSALLLFDASNSFYQSLQQTNGLTVLGGITGIAYGIKSSGKNLTDKQNRDFNIANILRICAIEIEKNFDVSGEILPGTVGALYKGSLEFDNAFFDDHKMHLFADKVLDDVTESIKKYDPAFEPPVRKKKKGCYVATCVYGSYDCPEVWTLRRYRDYQLAKTRRGRAFIHTYYAVAPTIVKLFGKTKWFNKLWKKKLDKKVKKLNEQGVENTPYKDIDW